MNQQNELRIEAYGEEWRAKSTYKELKELYDSNPKWKTCFPTFETFVDWARKVRAQIEKIMYLIAREKMR